MKRYSNRTHGAHKPARLLVGLLMGVSSWALSPPANAQTQAIVEDGQVRIAYDIPAQNLAGALTQYARQSDLRVLYPADRLAGRSAPPVRGSYTRAEALQLLMSRSGLSATITGETIHIQEERRPQQDGASAEPERVRADNETAAAEQAEDGADEEIVVVGTRIRGAAPAGANVIVLDRDYIDQSGQSTVAGLIQTLPQDFSGSQNEGTQNNTTIPGKNVAFASTVDLRGLGADATLSLVNGRRLAPAGFGNFVDVSAIPLSAVERVEVLADGASAIYGSDAVGGVVNFVLRSDFDGQEIALRYGDVTEGSAADYGGSILFGRSWAGGNIIAGYEYRRRDALANAERAFAANSDLTSLGGTNWSTNQGHPGTIIRIGATPTALAIPSGQDGTALTAAMLTPGINYRNAQEGADLLPEQESNSLFLSGRQDLTPSIEIYLDALASDREAHAFETQIAQNLTVPETNYYRQQNGLFAGQGNLTIAYSFQNDLGPSEYDARARTFSGITGARFSLPHDWMIDASIAYGVHRDNQVFSNVLDTTALSAALSSSSLATAFNPFSDGGNSSDGVLQSLRLRQATENDSVLTAYGLHADGALFALPGGDARAAIGVERRIEHFSIDRLNTFGSGAAAVSPTQAPGQRTTDAFYVELSLPFIGPEQHIPLIDHLDLSLSARQEHSDDYGTATTPKVGVTWGLTPDLSFRGSWGESFKAPQFQQTLAGVSGAIVSAPPAIDPFATNGSTGVLLLGGSNVDLTPETAESWTAGLHYAPDNGTGLRLSATYFDIDFSNRITTPTDIITAINNAALFPQYLIRNPTPEQIAHYISLADTLVDTNPPDGVELIFDARLANLATLRVRGIDLEASNMFHFDFGDVTVSAAASNLLQYSRQTNAASPSLDVLDTLYNPIDWHGRLSVGWTNADGWGAGATLNYTDDYRNTQITPVAEIDSFITLDLRLSRLWGGREDGVEAALFVQNVFDEDPPFANTPVGIGYDAANHSPFGRLISFSVRKRW